MANHKEASQGERVGNYSLQGLAQTWDNSSPIRARLRDRQRFLLQWDPKLKAEVVVTRVPKSIHSVRANPEALKPLLVLVRENHSLLPIIDRVMEEIQLLYNAFEIKVSGETVYHEAWALRQLVVLLKGEGARLMAENSKRKMKDPRFPSSPVDNLFKLSRILSRSLPEHPYVARQLSVRTQSSAICSETWGSTSRHWDSMLCIDWESSCEFVAR